MKEVSKRLGHSPKRREILKLAQQCYKYFNSFNKAKQEAGLVIKNVRVTNFPKNAFKIDKDLARIASYLTFDGYLYKDLSGMMYSSKNLNDLKAFEKIINKKFGLKGIYHLNSAGIKKTTHKIYVFNKKVSEKLFELGIPKGDKVIQKFNVPEWVSSSREFSREYLRIAYLCEGCNKEESGRTPRIQINIAKSEDILGSGLEFMNTLKTMLKNFDINTTKCYISGNRLRKTDDKISKDIRFRIDMGQRIYLAF